MDMTANIIAAAQKAGVRRLIFASSNHTVGNHMRDGPVLSAQAPELNSETSPIPDKFRVNANAELDFSAYASAKIAGEVLSLPFALVIPDLCILLQGNVPHSCCQWPVIVH